MAASPGSRSESPDRPVAAGLGEFLHVDGEVGTVEAPDADVGDPRHQRLAVVRRYRNTAAGDRLEVGGVEGEWFVVPSGRGHGSEP